LVLRVHYWSAVRAAVAESTTAFLERRRVGARGAGRGD
jgi:hypothetical protein